MDLQTCTTPAALTDALQQLRLELSGHADHNFTGHDVDHIAATYGGKYPIAMHPVMPGEPVSLFRVPLIPEPPLAVRLLPEPPRSVSLCDAEDGYRWQLASQPDLLLETADRELHLFLHRQDRLANYPKLHAVLEAVNSIVLTGRHRILDILRSATSPEELQEQWMNLEDQ